MEVLKKSIETGTAQLLASFYKQNDEKALTEFFLQYKDLTFKIAYSILGNQADADDIMQQSFIQIIKKQNICKAAFELDDSKVKSWVLSIVYNFARMHLRSQKSKKAYLLNEERRIMDETKESTAKDSSSDKNNETSIKLKTAIFNLPEKYRVPILMRYHEDMSIEEISKTLDSNPNTIRSILSRGVNLLRNKLSPENLMLSSTATIEMIASVPYPISQKIISIGFVKSCLASKSTSAKIALTTTSKFSLLTKVIFATLSFSALVAVFIHFNNSTPLVNESMAKPNSKNATVAESLKISLPQIYDVKNWNELNFKAEKGSLEIENGNLNTMLNEKAWVQFNGMPKTPYTIKFDLIGYSSKGKAINSIISGFFNQGRSTENFGNLNLYLHKENKIPKESPRIIPYRDGNGANFNRKYLFIKNEIYSIQNDKIVSKQRVEGNDGSKLSYGITLLNIDIKRIEIDNAKPELIEEALNGNYELQVSNLKKDENFIDIVTEK